MDDDDDRKNCILFKTKTKKKLRTQKKEKKETAKGPIFEIDPSDHLEPFFFLLILMSPSLSIYLRPERGKRRMEKKKKKKKRYQIPWKLVSNKNFLTLVKKKN